MFDISDTDTTAGKLGIDPGRVAILAQRLGVPLACRINDIDFYGCETIERMQEYLDRQRQREEASHVTR